MPLQSIWANINVPLPPLRFEHAAAAGQGKGSTEWAANSHTPVEVVEWTEFDELVTAEVVHTRNTRRKCKPNVPFVALELEKEEDLSPCPPTLW